MDATHWHTHRAGARRDPGVSGGPYPRYRGYGQGRPAGKYAAGYQHVRSAIRGPTAVDRGKRGRDRARRPPLLGRAPTNPIVVHFVPDVRAGAFHALQYSSGHKPRCHGAPCGGDAAPDLCLRHALAMENRGCDCAGRP